MSETAPGPVIGVDFDNTLISYDAILHQLALEAGLIGADTPAVKKTIRDAVRRSSFGEQAWQALQGQAYGPRIDEAEPAPGAAAFIARCRQQGVPVTVVSHKTAYARIDPTRTPMRLAAMGWLEARGFMPLEVRFGATRAEKLQYIRAGGFTHFIDDLEETFREPDFPAEVQGILYAPGGDAAPDLPGIRVVRSWAAIGERIFGV